MSDEQQTQAPQPAAVARAEDGRVFLTVGEQKWEVSPLDPDDWALIRKRVQERKLRPIDAVLEELQYVPAESRDFTAKHLFDRAYEEIKTRPADRLPTRAEVAAWLDTTPGAAYSAFLMMRHAHPDMTEKQAEEILKTVGLAEMQRRRDEANRQWIEAAKKKAAEEG